jgi:hypothetical protein
LVISSLLVANQQGVKPLVGETGAMLLVSAGWPPSRIYSGVNCGIRNINKAEKVSNWNSFLNETSRLL